tara:strand:- start:3424 stop:3735 length:312 start_codon:yes stop_codon:yes gene_type:complete
MGIGAYEWDAAPFNFVEGWLLAFKGFDELLSRLFWLQRVAAGKNVDSGVFKLWPSMDGQVGFGDNDHATNTDRIELMEMGINNCCPCRVCRGHHELFDFDRVV